MKPYRHRRQHRGHRFRYGIGHWNNHRLHTQHFHSGQKRKSGRRRWVLVVGGVVGLVVIALLILGGLSYRSLLHARDQLDDARATMTQALGNRDQLDTLSGRQHAKMEIAKVKADAVSARSGLQSSWALKVLGQLPLLDTQRNGLLQLVTDVETTTDVGDQLLQQVDKLTANSSGTTVSLPDLRDLDAMVIAGRNQLAQSNRPNNGLWGPLGSARDSFNAEDRKLTDLLGTGNDVLSYASLPRR